MVGKPKEWQKLSGGLLRSKILVERTLDYLKSDDAQSCTFHPELENLNKTHQTLLNLLGGLECYKRAIEIQIDRSNQNPYETERN